MPDAPGPIRVIGTHPPLASGDGKDVTIPIETDRNGTIEAVFSRELLAEVALQLGETARQLAGRSHTTLIPRKITVVKDHHSPDTFLLMEINNTTTYVIPIGPRLVSTLIDGLERARRVVSPLATRQ